MCKSAKFGPARLTQLNPDSPDTIARLRGLLAVSRLTRGDTDLPTLLGSIARIVSEALGVRTVAVNVHRPAWDDFEVAVVHGNPGAHEALLGQTRGWEAWRPLLDERYERRGAYFVPHGEHDWDELTTYIPSIEPSNLPDAWHPEDALLVPMHHSEGHVLGILSIDEPVSGRRPRDEELDVLVALAAHGAQAIEAAREASSAARHREALEQLMRVSARLSSNASTEEILRAVCEATRETLGFDVVVVELADREADRYRPRTASGIDLAEADVVLDIPLATLDAVFDPAFETEGCYLLSREDALARTGAEPADFESQANGRGAQAWNRHWLLVPLRSRAGEQTGFIWVDNPRDHLLPSRSRLQALRLFADQAEAALQSAEQLAALHEANEERRALIEASPVGILHLGPDRRIRSWNAAARRMFGYADEQVIGREPPWIAPEELPDFRRRFDAQLADEVTYSVFTDRRADGSDVEVSTTSAPLRGPDGAVTGMIAAIADISDQERAKRELARREAEMRAMIDASPVALMVLDGDGIVQSWNPAAEAIFGWTAEEQVGRQPMLVPAEAQAEFREATARVLAGESIAGIERTRFRKDGSAVEIILSAAPIRDEEGAIVGVMAAIEDVTERRRAAEDLALRNAELEALHETTLALIGTLEDERVLETVLVRAAELLGAGSGFLYLVDEKRNQLVPVVSNGIFAVAPDAPVERGDGLSGRVWREQRAMKIDDYGSWAGRAEAYASAEFGAIACVPLTRGDDVIGVLGVGHDKRGNVFSDADVELLERFGRLASLALGNARLHEAAQRELEVRRSAEREIGRRNAELEALHETALRLIERRDPSTLVEDIVVRAAELLGTNHGWVYRVDGEELVFEIGTGVFDANRGDRTRKHDGLAGHVVETGEPFSVDDYMTWPGRMKRFERAGFHAVAGVPLVSGDEVVGVLGLGYPEEGRTFGEAELALLTRFGRLASLALENARLWESARREIEERKAAEEALRQSQALYRKVVETSTDLITLLKPDGTVVFASASHGRVVGYDPEEIVGTEFSSYFHPDDEAGAAAAIAEAAAGGTPGAFHARVRHRDGDWVMLEGIPVPILDSTGKLELVLSIARDVTERHQQEEELRQSRELYRSVVENATDMISLISPEGTLLYASPSHRHMVGFETEELVGGSIFDQVHPEDAVHAAAVIANVRGRGEPVPYSTRVKHASGRWVTIEGVATPVRNEQGEVEMFLSTTRDVTERRRVEEKRLEAERSLLREKAYSEQLIQSANAMIVGLDRDGRIDVFNEEAERISGYKREELDGASWFETLAPRDRYPDVWATFEEWAAGGRMPDAFEHPILTKTGKERLISWRNSEIVVDGEPRGTLSFGIDLTEQRQLEGQLRQSQKMEAVGRLAGGVAHDFNNLLTAITGYGELALAKLPPDSPVRRNVEEMKRAGERAADLTRQLLAFSRRQVLQERALDLNTVVVGLEGMLARLLGSDVALVTELAKDLGVTRADPGQIEQVVVNLAINARDAMPRGGRLRIETGNAQLDADFAAAHVGAVPGEYVMVAVSDDGEGMDAGTLARIWEPFFTTKPLGRGTGLGLSTVYGIVKQTGGSIWAYSEPGRGSTFKVYLPRVWEQADISREPAAGPHLSGSETVLLVEDEDVVRSLVTEMLEGAGYSVIVASDAAEAETLASSHEARIDLLMTDVVMPGLSGPELAQRLLAVRPAMRVLFTSGYTEDAVAADSALAHGTAFLSKPFSAGDLAEKLRGLLDEDRAAA